MLEQGIYIMRMWVQAEQDKEERTMCESRFYPEVNKTRKDGSTIQVTVRPAKVRRLLNKEPLARWERYSVPLAEVRLVGPLNFTMVRRPSSKANKRQATQETHRIDEVYWKLMEERARELQIDVKHIREKPKPT